MHEKAVTVGLKVLHMANPRLLDASNLGLEDAIPLELGTFLKFALT